MVLFCFISSNNNFTCSFLSCALLFTKVARDCNGYIVDK